MSRAARWTVGVGLLAVAVGLVLRARGRSDEPSAPSIEATRVESAPEALAVELEELVASPVLAERQDVTPAAPPVDSAAIAEADEPAPANTFVLDVVVRDEDGAGLAGATVAPNLLHPRILSTTDSSGRCTIRITPEARVLELERVEISCGGYVTAVMPARMRESELMERRAQREWALERGLALACRVYDDRGTPIEGARVCARPPTEFSFGTHLWTADSMDGLDRGGNLSTFMGIGVFGRTDVDGLVALTVAKGEYEISAWARGFLRWESEVVPVESTNSDRPLEVRLTRGNLVRGMVRLADGTPVEGAQVYVKASGGIVPGWSDAAGQLEVQGIPLQNSYSVLLTHPSLAPLWRRRVLPGVFEEYVMDAGRTVRLRMIEAIEGEPVSGSVDVVKVSRDEHLGGRILLKLHDAKAVVSVAAGFALVDRIGTEVEALHLTVSGFEPATLDLPTGAGADLGVIEVSLVRLVECAITAVDEEGGPIGLSQLRYEVSKTADDGTLLHQWSGYASSRSLTESTFTLGSDRIGLDYEVRVSLFHRLGEYRSDLVVLKRAGDPLPESFTIHCTRF